MKRKVVSRIALTFLLTTIIAVSFPQLQVVSEVIGIAQTLISFSQCHQQKSCPCKMALDLIGIVEPEPLCPRHYYVRRIEANRQFLGGASGKGI